MSLPLSPPKVLPVATTGRSPLHLHGLPAAGMMQPLSDVLRKKSDMGSAVSPCPNLQHSSL
jgi:hypothetical protein